jgi:hypothetical protein
VLLGRVVPICLNRARLELSDLWDVVNLGTAIILQDATAEQRAEATRRNSAYACPTQCQGRSLDSVKIQDTSKALWDACETLCKTHQRRDFSERNNQLHRALAALQNGAHVTMSAHFNQACSIRDDSLSVWHESDEYMVVGAVLDGFPGLCTRRPPVRLGSLSSCPRGLVSLGRKG